MMVSFPRLNSSAPDLRLPGGILSTGNAAPAPGGAAGQRAVAKLPVSVLPPGEDHAVDAN